MSDKKLKNNTYKVYFQDFTPLHYAAGSNNNSSLSVLHKKGDSNLSLIPLLIVSSLNGCQKTISNITQIDQHAFAQKDTTQNGNQ